MIIYTLPAIIEIQHIKNNQNGMKLNAYEKILDECQNIFNIKILYIYKNKNNAFNASCAYKLPLYSIDTKWIQQIIQHPTKYHDAFYMTLGHELSHYKHDLNSHKNFFENTRNKNKKFESWVDEVHADFGGIATALSSNRLRGINAMEIKHALLREKFNTKNQKQTYNSHPPMEKRIEFIKKYNFNETLIRKIAEETMCNDENRIMALVHNYEEIQLY